MNTEMYKFCALASDCSSENDKADLSLAKTDFQSRYRRASALMCVSKADDTMGLSNW